MMYEEEKPRRNRHKSPSFSSSLLDEIYRSIDENSRNGGFQEAYKPNPSTKKQTQSHKAVLVEKWVEKQGNYSHHQEDDTLFFSSTSMSSDSSSGALSSDNEFFGSVKSSRSCFATIKKPKPVKTGKNQDFAKSEVEKNRGDKRTGEKNQDFIKSKSRALKIYANLKKVKDPISPGGKLTTFINNLFANSKKSSSSVSSQCAEIRKPSITTTTSACSSASSFSRSCLSKSSPNSRARFNDGARRTVRFYPVSVIVDEENRPCGKKMIGDTFPREVSLKVSEMKKTGPVHPVRDNFKNAVPVLASSINIGYGDYEDDEDEDALSDCSSDLFEIDHRAMFGTARFCEELPVYETTRIGGLIR